VLVCDFLYIFNCFIIPFLNKKYIVMCQADVMSHDNNNVMWYWQCHVSLSHTKCHCLSLYVFLFCLTPNFFKIEQFYLFPKSNL